MHVVLDSLDLAEAERRLCLEALSHAGTIVEAANLLGITRHALKRRITKHRISWPLPNNNNRRPGAITSIEFGRGASMGVAGNSGPMQSNAHHPVQHGMPMPPYGGPQVEAPMMRPMAPSHLMPMNGMPGLRKLER